MLLSRRSVVVPALLLAVALAACGSSDATTSTSSQPATNISTTSSTVAAKSAEQVSANDASVEELTTALAAAGVVPADRWAREVEEYRPYPADDPTFAKLRQELAKYNPSPETVDQIVGALSLP